MSDLKKYLCCGRDSREHTQVEYYRYKEVEWVCYEEWLPNLRVMVPHVVDAVLYDFIRRACIEFVKKTRILTRNIHLETQDNVADYYPCLGEKEHILGIRWLSVNNDRYKSLDNPYQWYACGHSFWFYPPNSLEISPAPKQKHNVVLMVDACPKEDSQEVDKILYDHYFEAILHYAASQAVLIPQASDAPTKELIMTSAYPLWTQTFTQAVQRAKLEQARGFSHGLASWR